MRALLSFSSVLGATLTAVLLTTSAAGAQPALRPTVLAGGATDAWGGRHHLRATLGQAIVGPAGTSPSTARQGFWPAASPARRLTLAVAPVESPLTVRAGEKFEVEAQFGIAASGPDTFSYWAEATYPDGHAQLVLGPITLLATPPTDIAIGLLQAVAADAPPGAYTYKLYAGTHPAGALSRAQFSFAVTSDVIVVQGRSSSQDPLASAQDRPASAPDHQVSPQTRLQTARQPRPSLTAPPFAAADRTGGEWLAYDAAGELLLAGMIMDYRHLGLAEADTLAKAAPDSAGVSMAPPALTIEAVPEALALSSPFPNPTRTGATVRFGLPLDTSARLTLYDLHGRTVAVLADGPRSAGWHEVTVSTDHLASGVYVVRLDAEGQVLVRRLTRLR